MIILGIPVIDQHDSTYQAIEYLAATASKPDVISVILIDNGSDEPYDENHLPASLPFNVYMLRSNDNLGYYFPAKILYRMTATADDLVVLMHNDLFIYEKGWDVRLRQAFIDDPKLGMVGFCGSNQVDEKGGRGGGTMMNFRGEKGQKQAGTLLSDLAPSCVLDSLFMAMRPAVVDSLRITNDIPICHFYDKIWPMRAIEEGWRVGTMGVEVDHLGGTTSVGNAHFREDCRKWLTENGIKAVPDPETALYLEAERQWLSEFRDEKHLIPCVMDGWDLHPLDPAGFELVSAWMASRK